MGTFEVGQVVIVKAWTPYGSHENCNGVILRKGKYHHWLVDVTFPDGNRDELGYDTDELAPATEAQPADEPAVDDVLRAGVAAADRALALERELAQQRQDAEDAEARVVSYWMGKVKEQRELAETLRSQLAAAQAALKPFAFCPIHPSWADDTRCVIVMNWNKPGLEVSVNEGLTLADVRRAVAALEATE